MGPTDPVSYQLGQFATEIENLKEATKSGFAAAAKRFDALDEGHQQLKAGIAAINTKRSEEAATKRGALWVAGVVGGGISAVGGWLATELGFHLGK